MLTALRGLVASACSDGDEAWDQRAWLERDWWERLDRKAEDTGKGWIMGCRHVGSGVF